MNPSFRIRNSYYFIPMLGKNFRRVPPHISESLDNHLIFFFQTEPFSQRIKNIKSAQSSSYSTSFGAPRFYWLTGKGCSCFIFRNFFKFIHHPGHYLGSGVYIRRRHIFMWSQNVRELPHPSAGESFEFSF